LFDSEKEMNFSYQYVSQMDPKYKMKDARIYGRDMYHVDRKVLKITPQVKYRHQMEILEICALALGPKRNSDNS
jgi:hypothetical protein